MTLPWMVQNESLLIEQEEHGPGPKPPDRWHVKAMKLPVPPAVCAQYGQPRHYHQLGMPLADVAR
jgi:hypothetical protein